MLKYVTEYTENKRKNGEFDEYEIVEDKELNAIVVNVRHKQPPLMRDIYISVDMLECLLPELIKTYLDTLFENERQV